MGKITIFDGNDSPLAGEVNRKLITAHPILFGWQNRKEWDGRGVQHVWGRGQAYSGFRCGTMREREHLEEPCVDGRIILRWIFRKWDVGLWTGLIWLRIVTSGGLLWMRYWIFGFYKMRGIGWLAENQLGSQERLLHGASKVVWDPNMLLEQNMHRVDT